MFCFMLISTADKHGEKENHITVCKHKFNATPSWMKHQQGFGTAQHSCGTVKYCNWHYLAEVSDLYQQQRGLFKV